MEQRMCFYLEWQLNVDPLDPRHCGTFKIVTNAILRAQALPANSSSPSFFER
jgi:hypothetical protein